MLGEGAREDEDCNKATAQDGKVSSICLLRDIRLRPQGLEDGPATYDHA